MEALPGCNKLPLNLTRSYTDPLLKAKAIFIWITDNISYDYTFLNKGKEIKGPRCRPGANCSMVLQKWEHAYLRKVLRKKKGICDGYARLFKRMADIAGLKSEIITGYTKTKPYHVGTTGPVNHAWNTIWLESTYFFLDPTWAAGFCEEHEESGRLIQFTKDFNEYYWLTPFRDLARNHYPKEGKWVMEPGYTKERFAAYPFIAPEVISKINLLAPASGVIQYKKSDTIHFRFRYDSTIHHMQVNTNLFRNPYVWKMEQVGKRRKIFTEDTAAYRKQRYILFRQEGSHYEFDYIVPDNSLYYLEILFDFKSVMRFKIIPSKTT